MDRIEKEIIRTDLETTKKMYPATHLICEKRPKRLQKRSKKKIRSKRLNHQSTISAHCI